MLTRTDAMVWPYGGGGGQPAPVLLGKLYDAFCQHKVMTDGTGVSWEKKVNSIE
jgi:hypothetical protein